MLEVIVFVFFIIFQRGVAEVQTLLYEGFLCKRKIYDFVKNLRRMNLLVQ